MEVFALKRSVRTLLTVVLVAVFLFSTGNYLLQQRDKAVGNSTYEEALQIAASGNQDSPKAPAATEAPVPGGEPQWVVAPVEEDDPHIKTLEAMDLAALREVNPDVVGWILIPDTVVNYPLMQAEDNNYYLERTWDHKSNAMGSIFLEQLSSPDLTDPNTIVYGHNMNDGSMFASLRNYREQAYFEAHPYVYILSDYGVYRYEIYSSYTASVKSNTYGVEFPTETSWLRFLEKALEDSVIETGVEPQPTDRVLTLSTCTGANRSARWVVHARLKMVLE